MAILFYILASSMLVGIFATLVSIKESILTIEKHLAATAQKTQTPVNPESLEQIRLSLSESPNESDG